MALDLILAIRGDLRKQMVAIERAVEGGRRSAISRRTTALKNTLRRQVTGAGLGSRLANAIRSVVITLADEDQIVGRVFSKAIVRRPSGRVDLITVFDEGATVRARTGTFLAIPTEHAGKGRGQKRHKTPAEYPSGTFTLIPGRRSGVAVLVFKDRPDVVAFVLVRQVTLRKQLNVQAAHAEAQAGLDDLVAREIDQRLARGVAA